MPLTLLNVPGFADIPDSALGAENPALALHLNRICLNAAFGMVRPEVFYTLQHHGDTVPLPQSPVDGYVYSRDELIYQWSIQSTQNPKTNWLSGPDSLWYCAWIVDQATGDVESIINYRQSGDSGEIANTNDGSLGVYTIAQRQRQQIINLDDLSSSWADIADSAFVTDAPLNQAMAQTLNRDAKLAVLGTEVIYMGEFKNGDTVPLPVSPADSYAYSYSQVKFQFSWRWTTDGTTFTRPLTSYGQLGNMKASINASTGVVSCSVTMVGGDSLNYVLTTYGRIVVVAYCSRQNLIGTLTPTANAFTEIDPQTLMPGQTLRASTLLQLMKNIREAACSCEYFGPTTYHNGNTVPLPVSPIDGYTYTRDEITTLWEWDDTLNDTDPGSHSHRRVAMIWGDIPQATGVINLRNWRFPPGSPLVESDSLCTIRVTVVASRGAQHAALSAPPATVPTDATTSTSEGAQPANSPYAVPFYAGQAAQPVANELLLRHIIPGDVASVKLPASLVGSYGGAVVAPTGAITITLKQNTTTIGTLNIAAGATVMTFSFLADITFSPGDALNVSFQATPDSTLAGLFFTLSGTRT